MLAFMVGSLANAAATRVGSIIVGESAEEMLSLALESEKASVAAFNAAAQECRGLGDHGTAEVFEEMVRDEERHADWFEAQLGVIERVGPAPTTWLSASGPRRRRWSRCRPCPARVADQIR
jgi:bacterioferritin (cytochrome b1)